MWALAAVLLRVPAEAAVSPVGAAIVDWDRPELRGGVAAVAPEARAALLLLAAVYAHLLLVLDDDDFYARQAPFTLGQQRAVAATLNSLLYHSLTTHDSAAAAHAAVRVAPRGSLYITHESEREQAREAGDSERTSAV
jgi:hypothetical protein